MDHGASDILGLLTTQLQGLDAWDLWDPWDLRNQPLITKNMREKGHKNNIWIDSNTCGLICCFYNSMDSRMSTDLLIWLLIVSK
jgi:hypothetical protein